MSPIRYSVFLILICAANQAAAQKRTAEYNLPSGYINIGDSIYLLTGGCKNSWIILKEKEIPAIVIKELSQPLQKIKIPLLTVHGNILYNFTYRSYIDTPFAETGVMQHLVQTNLNFLIKGKYPLRMTVSNRNSNSPYFRDATDVTFQFNRQQLLEQIKLDLRSKVTSLVHAQQLAQLENFRQQQLSQAMQLQGWLSSPARMQELVEEKERRLRSDADEKKNAIPNINGLPNASLPDIKTATAQVRTIMTPLVWKQIDRQRNKAAVVKDKISDTVKGVAANKMDQLQDKVAGIKKDSTVLEKIQDKKEQLAKLQTDIKKQEQKLHREKKKVQDSVNNIRREISSLSSGAGLYAFMKRHHISRDSLTKMQKLLLAVNKIGIGRSWLDYSELTVKNVSLTGFNIELNPAPFYLAAAVGKLNYRYRDFILKGNRSLPGQTLGLVRGGIGRLDKNYFILTVYNGKKELLSNAAAGNPISLQKVLGISGEAKFMLNTNNYIFAEIAKSSYGNNTAAQSSQSNLEKTLDWKLRTNEAYSVKLFSQYPLTDTRLQASYRKMGENFQSFTLYPTGSNQDAWMARVTQSFWKRKLVADAAIRKNDFVSPIAAPGYNSRAVFKSFQLTFRAAKYPFISVGYYPSSQLSLSNNNVLMENQYNTLNATVSHNYSFKSIAMNSNVLFTRFYNSGSDTGFIYYNATSYTFTQSIYIASLMLQGQVAVTDQQNLHLFTAEPLLSYQFKNRISVSGSFKWSRLNHAETLLGGTAGINMYFKKLGTLQLSYDKSWLPGYSRLLVPVDIGRAGFYREF